jgi:predicted ABC-type ATPase
MDNPRLYIIAGCNGAGKTTASFSVLPQILQCQEFVNADEIARGLSPFHPESMAVEAGRLMLKRIDYLLTQHLSFAIETTLATRSYHKLVKRAQRDGYKVILLFFWLESPQMAEQRVAKRVREGGHDIPRDVIHRRYWLGLDNLFYIYMPIVDSWSLYDNNKSTYLIADTGGVVDNVKFENIRKSCQKKSV